MILNKNLAKALFLILTVVPVSFQNIYATSNLIIVNSEQLLSGFNLPENIVTDLNQEGIQTLGQLSAFFKKHAKPITTIHKLKGQIVSLLNQVFLEKTQNKESVDEDLLKTLGDNYLNYLHKQLSPHFNLEQQNSYTKLMAKYQKARDQDRPKGTDVFDRHFEALKVFLADNIKFKPKVKVTKKKAAEIKKTDISFESLGIGKKIVSALNQNGITTWEQLSKFSLEQFDFIKGLREIKSDIIEVLQKNQLQLADYSQSMMDNSHILSLPFRNLILWFEKESDVKTEKDFLQYYIFNINIKTEYIKNDLTRKYESDISTFTKKYKVENIVTLQELLEKMIEQNAFDKANQSEATMAFEKFLFDNFNISIDVMLEEKHISEDHTKSIKDFIIKALVSDSKTNPINLSSGIEELDLELPTYNCLKKSGIDTIQQLCDLTESEILQIHNMGDYRLKHIKEFLRKRNLKLKDDLETIIIDDQTTKLNNQETVPVNLSVNQDYEDYHNQRISSLNLNSSISDALTTEGIDTLEDLCKLTQSQLHNIKGIGARNAYVIQIQEALLFRGLNLKIEVNEADIKNHFLSSSSIAKETIQKLIYKNVLTIDELKEFLRKVHITKEYTEKKLQMHAVFEEAASSVNQLINKRLLKEQPGYFDVIKDKVLGQLSENMTLKLQEAISAYDEISKSLVRQNINSYYYSDNISLEIYDELAPEYLDLLSEVSQNASPIKVLTLETTIGEFIMYDAIKYRTTMILSKAGMRHKTISDLISMTPSELLNIEGLGESALKNIQDTLKNYGFSLKPDHKISPDSISSLKALPKGIRSKLRTMGIINISQIEESTARGLFNRSQSTLSEGEAHKIIEVLAQRKQPKQKLEQVKDKPAAINLTYDQVHISAIQEVPQAVSDILESNGIITLADLIQCTEEKLLTFLNQETVEEIKVILQNRSLELKKKNRDDDVRHLIGGLITMFIREIGGPGY